MAIYNEKMRMMTSSAAESMEKERGWTQMMLMMMKHVKTLMKLRLIHHRSSVKDAPSYGLYVEPHQQKKSSMLKMKKKS